MCAVSRNLIDKLVALGEVIVLPKDAKTVFEEAERDDAKAAHALIPCKNS